MISKHLKTYSSNQFIKSYYKMDKIELKEIPIYCCKHNAENKLECFNSLGFSSSNKTVFIGDIEYYVFYGCMQSCQTSAYDLNIVFPSDVKNAKIYLIKKGGKKIKFEFPSIQITRNTYELRMFDKKHQLSFYEHPDSIYIIKIMIPTYNNIILHDIVDNSIKLFGKY